MAKGKIIIDKKVDPNDTSKEKSPVDKTEGWNEKDFDDLETGEDLDIQGAELDDEMEDIGSEDEENNYYSIGGDRHED